MIEVKYNNLTFKLDCEIYPKSNTVVICEAYHKNRLINKYEDVNIYAVVNKTLNELQILGFIKDFEWAIVDKRIIDKYVYDITH